MTPSDGELLSAHLAGDRRAFAELVNRHQRTLWAVARRALVDERDAAEAVQDALLRAHQHAGGYRADASVRTWLVRILVRVCLDRHRAGRRRVVEQRMEGAALALVAARRDPIAEHQLRMELSDALARLPFDQRIVVVLVSLFGYSMEEVAGILEVSVGTVKSRTHRGRARLAELLVGSPLPERGGSRARQLTGEGA